MGSQSMTADNNNSYASVLACLWKLDKRWDVTSSGAFELNLGGGLFVYAWDERDNVRCNWRVWASRFDEETSNYSDLPAEVVTRLRSRALNGVKHHETMAIAFNTAAEQVLAQLGLASSLVVKKKRQPNPPACVDMLVAEAKISVSDERNEPRTNERGDTMTTATKGKSIKAGTKFTHTSGNTYVVIGKAYESAAAGTCVHIRMLKDDALFGPTRGMNVEKIAGLIAAEKAPAKKEAKAPAKKAKKVAPVADPRRVPTDKDEDRREPCLDCGTEFGGRNPSGKVERSIGRCQSCYNKFRRTAK